MKDVFFVYRKSGLNYSIEHVFNTVESGLRKENVLVKNIFLPYARVCVSNLLRNILYVKNRHKAQRKAKFYINKCRSASCMQSGWKRTSA